MPINQELGFSQRYETAWIEEVIITTNARRGNGDSETNPIRIIRQVFTKSGELIAEYDPFIYEKKLHTPL